MSYREDEIDTPAANMRSYMCMRSFQYEVGGDKENIDAHAWLNAMRKDGWHLVSMSTSIGKIQQNLGGFGRQPDTRTIEGNVITFVMEGTKPDPQHNQGQGQHDHLGPVQDALMTTTNYGSNGHNGW